MYDGVFGGDTERRPAMAVLSDIVTADNGLAVYAAGVSGNARRHAVSYVGWTVRNSLILGSSRGNPNRGAKKAMELFFFQSERRISRAPFHCGEGGGPYFGGNYGSEFTRGSPIGLGGEGRVHNVAILRFWGAADTIMTFSIHGNNNGNRLQDGAQPTYFKNILIDRRSRDRLIYLAPPQREWITMQKCIRMVRKRDATCAPWPHAC